MTEKDIKCNQCTPDSMNKLKNNTDETITWCNCENCDKWIHAICDNLTKEEAEKTSKYYCKKCRDKISNSRKTPEKATNPEKNVSTNNNLSTNESQKPVMINQNDNLSKDSSVKPSIFNDDENDEDEIIPNSQPMTETLPKNPQENIFSQKKQTEKTDDNDKSEALSHRKKATILKEYKKLEMKIKDRDEKYREKVETIDQLNKEIQKMKEEQNSLNATIISLTTMKNQDEQSQIRNAIEAQKMSEKKAAEVNAENQKLKKNNTEKQSEIRKLKEHSNKIEQNLCEYKEKYGKEYKENVTLNKLIEFTNASKKSIEENIQTKDESIKQKDELLKDEKCKTKTLEEKVKKLESELKAIAEEKYRKIDPGYDERRKDDVQRENMNKESNNPEANTTADAIEKMVNTIKMGKI